MPHADYKKTNTWKEFTSREPVQFFEDKEDEEYEDMSDFL